MPKGLFPWVLLAPVSVGPRPLSVLLWKMIGLGEIHVDKLQSSCTGITIGDRDGGVSSYAIPPSSNRTTETKKLRITGIKDSQTRAKGPAAMPPRAMAPVFAAYPPKLTLRIKVVSIISRDQEDEITFSGRVTKHHDLQGPVSASARVLQSLTSTNKVPVTSLFSSGSTRTRPPE
ncbi:hypothetical protein PV11_04403 [Exophiala sideris]|uniref:Uncharacterized protein n=1 Tax=Exophiala sideris TaxID=1016849 RepID=A0A0D1YHF0_9EURO|nr:hypothetical protein PV11_04403 [Exophiala sideris]